MSHFARRCIQRFSVTQSENGIIQSALKKNDQVFPCNTLVAIRNREVVTELTLHDAVDPSGLLLFTQLDTVIGVLHSAAAVLSWGVWSALNSAFV